MQQDTGDTEQIQQDTGDTELIQQDTSDTERIQQDTGDKTDTVEYRRFRTDTAGYRRYKTDTKGCRRYRTDTGNTEQQIQQDTEQINQDTGDKNPSCSRIQEKQNPAAIEYRRCYDRIQEIYRSQLQLDTEDTDIFFTRMQDPASGGYRSYKYQLY